MDNLQREHGGLGPAPELGPDLMVRHARRGHVADHAPDGAPSREPFDRNRVAHIAGWGVDLDKAQRPAVPMERRPPRLPGAPLPRPSQQVPRTEVLHSTERPGLTPIFGTSAPLRGPSGALRRFAFRYSENDLRHWLTLLVADRVDMAEGLIEDLAHGHVPNLPAEMGWPAELRHNKAGAVRKMATIAVVGGLAWWWWHRRDRHETR